MVVPGVQGQVLVPEGQVGGELERQVLGRLVLDAGEDQPALAAVDGHLGADAVGSGHGPDSITLARMAVDKSVPEVAWPTLAVWAGVLAGMAGTFALGASHAVPAWAAGLAATAFAFWAFTPMHDAAHGSVSRRPWLNRLVGETSAVVLGGPYAAFRHAHLTHHRFTNEVGRDPDRWTGLGPWWQLPLRWATIEPHYYVFYAREWDRRPAEERAAFLASWAVQAALLWALGWDALWFWVLPARAAMFLLAFSFDWLPHQPYAALQSEDRIRATHVTSLPLLTPLWLWQNYHLIHHLYPAVPCYRYARVWEEEGEALKAKGARDLWEEWAGPRPT
ncbi:delta(12)-fatty acid dehydrogenase [bacterium]|nr:MAG: delta(12)-fatty acid dehydrogenase [bacterium]